jgi:hypothetical protein
MNKNSSGDVINIKGMRIRLNNGLGVIVPTISEKIGYR